MAKKSKPDPLVDMMAYTVKQFCQAFQISPSTYYALKQRGEGPRERKVGGSFRIMVEDAKAWSRRRK